jgi:hypothetical protein
MHRRSFGNTALGWAMGAAAILGHSPGMGGGNYPQMAYGLAYMKALLNRADAERKG